jgi:predicted RND superfamily exporter protein
MKKILKHPKVVIAVCLAITLFFCLQLKNLEINNDVRSFLPQKDASYTRLLETEDTFGSMIVTGVSLETDGTTILTADNIKMIDRITKAAEAIPHVESVQSLTNIDYVEGQDGALVAGSLVDDSFTGSDAEIGAIKEKIASWSDLYDRVIISDDGKAAQIQVTLEKGSDKAEKQVMLDSLRSVLDKETKGTGIVWKVYGDPVIDEQAQKSMLQDLKSLIPLVIVVVMLSLMFSFGTFDGTFLPLVTVLLSTVWSVGLMSLFHQPFTIVSSVIPVALIAVGSAYGIHVLTHYYVALDNNKEPLTKERYQELVFAALKDVMPAVMLAGVTTIVGFISLMSSPIVPLHSFAIFTAVGVGLSLLLAITFIPAVLLLKPLDKVGDKSKLYAKLSKKVESKVVATSGGKIQGNGQYAIYRALAGSKARLVLFLAAIIIVSCIGLSKLVVDTSLVSYFPADGKVRQDIDSVDKNFAGTNSVYFTIKGEKPGDITNPEVLKPMDDMQTYLEDKYPEIGKIVGFNTFVKRMNQVMHIPEPVETVAEDAATEEDDGTELSSFSSFDTADATEDDGSALSSFGSFDTEDTTDTSTSSDSYVDPNIAYGEKLSKTMTTEEALGMLKSAYVKAGGANASVSDIVDELEKSLNYEGKAYYEIPYDTAKYPVASREELSSLVSQYLLLFSGSLDSFNDDPLSPQTTRMVVQLKTHSTNKTKKVIADAQAYATAHFPKGYTLEATGTGEMEARMTDMVVSSQLQSLLSSLISVIVILSIAFRSVWAGLIGGVPLLLSILLNYMIMGFTGINLDLVTSIIASVAVGVGIDYTIHFMETYKAERALISDNLEVATRETFRKSGSGIVANAMAVGLGFLVLCLSQFVVLRYIGVLVAVVMFTSSFLAMTVIPGILNVCNPKFMRKQDSKEQESEDDRHIEAEKDEKK